MENHIRTIHGGGTNSDAALRKDLNASPSPITTSNRQDCHVTVLSNMVHNIQGEECLTQTTQNIVYIKQENCIENDELAVEEHKLPCGLESVKTENIIVDNPFSEEFGYNSTVQVNEQTFIGPESDPLEIYTHDSRDMFQLETSGDNKWFRCLLCDFRTRLRVNIRKHFRNRHDQNVDWYKCHLCEHKVKKKYNLEAHIRNMHEENIVWYHCHLCQFKSKQKSAVTRHFLDKHEENIEWHHCELCSFKTKRKHNLKLHFLNKHTDSFVWHECAICNLRFKQKQFLIRHLKQHYQDAGSYQCHLCDYLTKDKIDLKNHVRSKHKEKYQCRLCEFSTHWKPSLTRHLLKVHQIVITATKNRKITPNLNVSLKKPIKNRTERCLLSCKKKIELISSHSK